MSLLETAIWRVLQAVGLVAILVGFGQAQALIDAINAAVANPPWRFEGVAPRIAAVAGPILLGSTLVAGLQAYIRQASAIARRAAEFPGQPWLWRQDWADRHVRLSNRQALVVLPICWTFVLLVAAPLAYSLSALKQDRGLNIFLSCFVGGMVLILFAITKQGWVNRHWNRSELRLAAVPGVIGGPISGVVLLNDTFSEGTTFRIAIVCERTTVRRRSGRQGGASTDTSVAWQADRTLNRTIDTGQPGQTGLPFQFAIDYACLPTGHDQFVDGSMSSKRTTSEAIHWYVRVALKDDLHLREIKFEVPVFKTAESSAGYVANETVLDPYLEKPDALAVLQRSYFAEVPLPDGKRLEFSLFSWLLLFGLVIMFAICGGGAVAIGWWVPMPPALFVGLIPAVLALLAVYGLAEMLLWRGTATITADCIEIETGWIGFRRRVEFPRDSPPVLKVHEQFKKQHGAWFSVDVVNDDQRLTLIQRLDGLQEANVVRDWLAQQWT